MYPSVDMESMTWLEYREKIDSILILPVGATEQHGPHLPLCVDALLAREFARRLAQKTNGIVAPTLSYGYKSKPQSGGGPLFPGTIDLSGAALQQLAADLIDEFVRDGFTKIFIMNAHFENDPFLIEAMDLCAAKYDGRVTLVLSNWWDPMPDELIGRLFDETPFPGWAAEHAAITETSLMLYFAPELVHMDRIDDSAAAAPCAYHRYPVKPGCVPASGVLASARSSSAEKGRRIADAALPRRCDLAGEPSANPMAGPGGKKGPRRNIPPRAFF